MTFLKRHWHRFVFLSYALLLPAAPISAAASTCPPGQICNPLGPTGPSDIPTFIQTFLEGAIRIGLPIVVLAIVYSGFLFVAARGNSEKLKKAKDSILYTLIGAAILLGSWAIAEMISATVTGLGTGV